MNFVFTCSWSCFSTYTHEYVCLPYLCLLSWCSLIICSLISFALRMLNLLSAVSRSFDPGIPGRPRLMSDLWHRWFVKAGSLTRSWLQDVKWLKVEGLKEQVQNRYCLYLRETNKNCLRLHPHWTKAKEKVKPAFKQKRSFLYWHPVKSFEPIPFAFAIGHCEAIFKTVIKIEQYFFKTGEFEQSTSKESSLTRTNYQSYHWSRPSLRCKASSYWTSHRSTHSSHFRWYWGHVSRVYWACSLKPSGLRDAWCISLCPWFACCVFCRNIT